MLRAYRWLVPIAAIALAACAIALACSPPRWQNRPPSPVTSTSTRPPSQPPQVAEDPREDGGVRYLDPSSDASSSVIIDAGRVPPIVPARYEIRAAVPPPDAAPDATLPPVPDGGLVRDAATPLRAR